MPAERDLKRHLRGEVAAAPKAPAEDDFQLRTAVDYLKAVDILKASPPPPRGVAAQGREQNR
jgi:carboxyl-terminal processing protease